MFQLKPIISGLLGSYALNNDPNKNGAGKGTLQRFVEMLGDDFDQELVPLIELLVENNLMARTASADYLPILEADQGNVLLYLSNSAAVRRHIIKYWKRLVQIKGTNRCLKHLFALMGFNAVITEHTNDYTFDSSITFDDSNRTFDSGGCNSCDMYSLDLTRISGSGDPSQDELEAIESIIAFNEPMTSKLLSLTFNGSPVSLGDFSSDFNNDYLT